MAVHQPAPMTGTSVLQFPALTEGVLLKRYKRFLADVELNDGQIVTVHCANTGPMKGVLHPGGRVRVRHAPSPKRKLAWTWEQAEVPSSDGTMCWAGINTALPNKLIRALIEVEGLKDQLGPIKTIRAEVPYGLNRRSRIDLLLTPDDSAEDQRLIYIEVKNTTWSQDNLALFPDTVTERGQKHLEELTALIPDARGVLIPCLSRPDVTAFAPGDSADPRYGELFREAMARGVEIFPCCFSFDKDQITWEGLRQVFPRQ